MLSSDISNKKISFAEAKTFYTVKVFTTVKLPDNNNKGNLLMIKSIEVNISEVRKSLQRLDTAKSFLWRLLQQLQYTTIHSTSTLTVHTETNNNNNNNNNHLTASFPGQPG